MDLEKTSKIIGMFAVIAPIVWGGFTYSNNLQKERKASSFKNYHDIVAEIYDGGRREYAGSQRALIFELKNFPEYREFTCREVPRMKGQFKNPQTLEEIDIIYKELKC
jgi:hypothetical protein